MRYFRYVVILIVLAIFFHCNPLEAASFTISPLSVSKSVGDTITYTVSVSSPTTAINAVSGNLVLPSVIAPVSISTTNSIINFWIIGPAIKGNSIQFQGLILNPGYIGTGTLFSFTVKTEIVGAGKVNFQSGAILANDGLGTNVITTMESSVISVGTTNPLDIAPSGPLIPVPPVVTEASSSLPLEPLGMITITQYPETIKNGNAVLIEGTAPPNNPVIVHMVRGSSLSPGEEILSKLFPTNQKEATAETQVNSAGQFSALLATPLAAGAYNAWAETADVGAVNIQSSPVSIQIDYKIFYQILISLINLLLLVIPIALLISVIIFIPWVNFHLIRLLGFRFKKQEHIISKDTPQLPPDQQ